ncbi:MAG TPA: non-ribosomal peptide synthetase [Kofleriaceae bacterium]|jgi:amino acid adenylation domain-containing protein
MSSFVHQLIEAQVDRTPDAVAVTFEGRRLTYRELDEHANQLARQLIAAGVRRGRTVGVRLERSIELIVTLLAIPKAGAAYVPISPSSPAARVDAIVRDSGCAFVVDRAWLDSRTESARTRPLVPVDGDLAVYVIFTSGSTGQPKGVVVTHAALRNHVIWMKDALGLRADDAVLQKTPFTFDASVWEIFLPLVCGARLVVASPDGHRDPRYLADIVRREQITTLQFVPSMLGPVLDAMRETPPRSVRRVVCGGEALTGALQRACTALLGSEVINFYGPTEATIEVSWWRCEPDRDYARVPIGVPVANTRLYVLDKGLQQASAGELYAAGVQLARGYAGRPDLTAERFVPDPFHVGERMYRTGDHVRLADGILEFVGRLDHQVKLRGFRIELGEIEFHLRSHPDVRDGVVIVREDRPGEQRLVAYVTGAVEPGSLRDHLEKVLVDYMIPSAFLVLAALPLTAHGKVDRDALPAPESVRAPASGSPTNDTERALVAILSALLGVANVGVDDSFFELGGHSLLAVQLASQIEDTLGVTIDLADVFDHDTARGLARVIAALP